ncbi:MAG: hypothetical protein AABN95_17355 [Acidobacteriota bacterium]
MRKATFPEFLTATLALLVMVLHSYAQTPKREKSVPPNAGAALLLLDSAASDLKKIENMEERISLAESITKLLSSRKPETTREMLDALFEDALKRTRSDSAASAAKEQSADAQIWRIIRIAASFDSQLGKSYVEKYTEKEKTGEDSEQSVQVREPLRRELYLRLATELIERDPALAISLAGSVIKTELPAEALVFLGTLRKRDVGLANGFFMSALQSIRSRRGENINELLLLYSYALSPLQVPQVRTEGLVLLQLARYRKIVEPYSEDPAVARQFLSVAVGLLVNASRYNPDRFERLTAGAIGDFFVLTVIEPHVARYFPALIPSLINQRVLLAGYIRGEQRSELQAQTDRWNSLHSRTGKSSANGLNTSDYFLEWAEQAANAKQRDQLYCKASMAAVQEEKFESALDIVGKISMEFRDEAKQFILFNIAMKAALDQQFEKAEEMARGDNDLVRRAYLFTLIAKSILDDKAPDVTHARLLLDEVERLAPKLSNDRERLAVLAGSAAVYSLFDSIRGFELFRMAVKIANRTEGFTGETFLARSLDIAGFYFDYSMYVQEFTFAEAIDRLGLADFNETLLVIRDLKDNLVRLKATVAICSAALSGKTYLRRVLNPTRNAGVQTV